MVQAIAMEAPVVLGTQSTVFVLATNATQTPLLRHPETTGVFVTSSHTEGLVSDVEEVPEVGWTATAFNDGPFP